MATTTFSGPVKSDNGFEVSAAGGGVTLPAYTVAALPATATAGLVIYVSDANTGVGTIAFGDGTDFIDIKTGLAVA
jgi:hypothetical protein